MRSRLLTTLVAAVCAAVLLGFSAASAGPQTSPPGVSLRADEAKQRGGLFWVEWTSGRGRYCSTVAGDGTGEFPRWPLEVSGDEDIHFEFAAPKPLKRVRIEAWTEVDHDSYPVGQPELIPNTVAPILDEDGEVEAWRASFEADPSPELYLRLYSRWKYGACGGPRDSLRTFHLASPDRAT